MYVEVRRRRESGLLMEKPDMRVRVLHLMDAKEKAKDIYHNGYFECVKKNDEEYYRHVAPTKIAEIRIVEEQD